MKVIAIVGDESNQRALTAKINQVVPLSHIARVRLPRKGRRKLIRSAVSLTFGSGLRRAWRALHRYYDKEFPHWPTLPTSDHRTANAGELTEMIKREKPDLIVISGTDLLKKSTLERFATNVMNLHTGLSPYIKESPQLHQLGPGAR